MPSSQTKTLITVGYVVPLLAAVVGLYLVGDVLLGSVLLGVELFMLTAVTILRRTEPPRREPTGPKLGTPYDAARRPGS
jgi:hypothetical protein